MTQQIFFSNDKNQQEKRDRPLGTIEWQQKSDREEGIEI
jgi:hypothetical protein